MNQWLVLYCLLNNKEEQGDIVSSLRPEFFYEETPREIYLYIIELFTKGLNPDISLVSSKFGKKVKESLENVQVDTKHYPEYITNLRKNFLNIESKKLGNTIANREEIEESELVGYIDKFISSLSTSESENLHYASTEMKSVLESVNQEEEKISEIQWGINSLDEHTGGLWPGEYIVIAGRPSMGKSGLMAHIAMANSLAGKNVVLFSLEMAANRILTRMLANYADIELWKLKRIKRRSEEEQNRVIEAAKAIEETPLAIDTSASLTIEKMRSILQKVKLHKGSVDCIVVDYIQLMQGRGESDNSRVSQLSAGLKGLSLQFNAPVVVGSQLSRSCEQREDKRPILSDLRDSGSIEQDADIVAVMYRDCYYNYNKQHEKILEVILRKYRDGETTKKILEYNMKKQTFKGIDYNSSLGAIARRFEYV